MGGFFSKEAGQARTRARDAFLDKYVADPFNYLFGPTGVPERVGAAAGLLEFTDAGDIAAAADASRDLWNNPSLGSAANYTAAGAALALPVYSAKLGEGAADLVDDIRKFAVDEYGGPGRNLDEVEQRGAQIMDMLQSGRASEITDDMLGLGDPVANTRLNQYLFENYDLPMDEASRMARADKHWPSEGYHGTTHEFSAFGGNTRNKEGHFGAGDYLTTSAADASDNYAGFGPDLTQRIERRAEQIASDLDLDYVDPTVMSQARAELAGSHEGAVMPLRVGGREVSVIPHTRGQPTVLETEFPYSADDFIEDAKDELGAGADKWEIMSRADEIAQEANLDAEPKGTLADFVKSIESQAWESDFDAAEALEPIQEYIFDGFISADDLDRKMRSGLPYAEDPETGELIGSDVIRKAFNDAGYPNIRMSANSAGWNMPIPEGTEHIISSNPANIRSRFARFDPRLKHLRNLSAGLAGVGILNSQDEEELKEYLGLL